MRELEAARQYELDDAGEIVLDRARSRCSA